MAEIQLLIDDEGNRRALETIVNARHTVVVDEELQDVDLCVVDERTLPAYRDALEARKRQRHPGFLPVVLIRREHTPVDTALMDPDSTDGPFLIDEVLTAPVEKAILSRRLANLLARREQTEELLGKTEQLEELVSKLRHEFRNPLNVLDGYLSMAEDDFEYLEECKRAVDRMDRMIDDLLVTTGEDSVPTDPEPVDLATLLERSWQAVDDSRARLTVETERRLYADRDLLQQLLENLLRNSVEHGSTSPPSQAREDAGRESSFEPSVADAPEDDPASDAVVSITVGDLDDGFYVEDDGPGIPESKRDAIFEKGYSTGAHGTGLGMVVVDEVADAHGWDVRVTESDDGGARFEIRDVEFAAGGDA